MQGEQLLFTLGNAGADERLLSRTDKGAASQMTLRQLDSRSNSLTAWDNAIDQSELVCTAGGQWLTRHRQLERLRHGQPVADAHQAAGARKDASLYFGETKGRVFFGDDQVARQADFEATAQREAVDGGDQWLGELAPSNATE